MRRNVVVLLIAGLGGAWWIGSLVTGMLHPRSDIVVEKNVLQSTDLKEPATANVVSPFDVLKTRPVPSKVQSQTDSTDSSQLVSTSNPQSIKRSLQVILQQPLTGESETALQRTLRGWSVTEPAETALWIEQTLSETTPGSDTDALVYPLLYQWIEIEPQVALARLGAFAGEDEIPYLMLSHAERLAEENSPAEALEWARSLEDKASSAVVVDGLLQRWLEDDVTTLATQLESEAPQLRYGADTAEDTALGDNPATAQITDDFIEIAATALMEQDPARALQWADALPDTAAEKVRSKTFDSWLVQDPVAASDWLSRALSDTGTIPVSVASSIPQRDIDLAINTLPMLSDASHSAMTSAIVETLSEVDPDNARAWVDGLVDPEDRSAAITVWAIANAERQPGEALDSALESTSNQRRLDTLMNVAASVARVDQPLLESWLAAAPLNDYERSQIASVVFDAEVYPFQ